MTETTMAENRNINQIMKDRDWEKFINNNKTQLLGLLVLVILGIFGFGFYLNHKDNSKADSNDKIFQYEKLVLKEYLASKDATRLVGEFSKLHKNIGDYIGLIPLTVKVSDQLMADNKLVEAKQVLEEAKTISSNDYATYFVLSRLAVVYEDLGDIKTAISTLEKMNSSSVKIFEGKNYLDLGRLYLKENNKEKAKASFQYVVDKANTEIEFVKLAKLYLTKI